MAHHMNFDGQKKSKQNCHYERLYILRYREKKNYKYAYHMKLQHKFFWQEGYNVCKIRGEKFQVSTSM